MKQHLENFAKILCPLFPKASLTIGHKCGMLPLKPADPTTLFQRMTSHSEKALMAYSYPGCALIDTM
jgi:hypothetical protein